MRRNAFTAAARARGLTTDSIIDRIAAVVVVTADGETVGDIDDNRCDVIVFESNKQT
jgi:hypothetical protein